MKVKEAIEHLKIVTLPNVTPNKQMNNENLIVLINEAMNTIYGLFNVKREQAIVLVPAFRKNFRISRQDPNVIMATHAKLAKCEMTHGGFATKAAQIEALKEMNITLDKEVMLENEAVETNIFKTNEDEIYKILSVRDDKDSILRLNEVNVFAINQDTLFFPNAKEGDIYYVEYKPKPIKVTSIEDELDLPSGLLDVLYAYVALRIVTNIEGYKQYYGNALTAYNNEVEKAIMNQQVIPDSLIRTTTDMKGFC